MTWKASLLLAIPFLIAGCSSDHSESSANNGSTSSNEETQETEKSTAQNNSSEQTPTEYVDYNNHEDKIPFYKMEVPKEFRVDPDYYSGSRFLTVSYEPEDIDYFYEGDEDYIFDYDQVSTLRLATLEIAGDASDEEYLDQLRTKAINNFVSNGTSYEVIEAENTAMGPFAYGLRIEEDNYTQITFQTAHDGYNVQAELTIPHDTEEEDMILDRALKALQTVTFDDPETLEKRPDKTRSKHEVIYEPYERSKPGTIAEDSYSMTLPAFPEDFSLTNADPADYYVVEKTYEDIVQQTTTEHKHRRSSVEIFNRPAGSDTFTSEEEVIQSTMDKDIDSWYPYPGEIETATLLKDSFNMGDFTTGVHVELATYEQYFFITETETSVIVACYDLIPGTEDYEELKSLYEEAIATFELR